MRVSIAGDHGMSALEYRVVEFLQRMAHDVVDFGTHGPNTEDDYPDFIIPMAVAAGDVEQGVGASVAANKVAGVRAGLNHDIFSARQRVEDDDMNALLLRRTVICSSLALDLVETFLTFHFSGASRHRRRLAKVQTLEDKPPRFR